MKTDVALLKTDVAELKTGVAGIRSNYATKADIIHIEATLLKWYVGSVFAMAGLLIAAVKFLR